MTQNSGTELLRIVAASPFPMTHLVPPLQCGRRILSPAVGPGQLTDLAAQSRPASGAWLQRRAYWKPSTSNYKSWEAETPGPNAELPQSASRYCDISAFPLRASRVVCGRSRWLAIFMCVE
jgi:hypothetical protein